MSKGKTKKEPTLEEAMARIEEILRLMDSEQGTLDQSLEWFEEGTALVRFCSETLKEAKLRVKEVMAEDEPEQTQGE